MNCIENESTKEDYIPIKVITEENGVKVGLILLCGCTTIGKENGINLDNGELL